MKSSLRRPHSVADLEHLEVPPSLTSSGVSSSEGRPDSQLPPSQRPTDETQTQVTAEAIHATGTNSSNVRNTSSNSNGNGNSNSATRPRIQSGAEWPSFSSRLPGRSLEEGDMPIPSIPSTTAPSKNTRCVSETPPSTANGGTTGTNEMSTAFSPRVRKMKLQQQQVLRIFDDPHVTAGYASVPVLEQDELPRGGVSVDTVAVGRIQFGIPPETIKDSMLMGIDVPRIYIVPRERFCSDWGPALGINLAEFEFPAYFNYFVRQKKCCLVVDNLEAEMNIRSVFEETLLGPKKYRDHDAPLPHADEDFDPDYPVDMRPNFYQEFQHFRAAEKTAEYDELSTDMLLDFYHFEKDSNAGNLHKSGRGSILPSMVRANDTIGVPPLAVYSEVDEEDDGDIFVDARTMSDSVAIHSTDHFNRSMDVSHFPARDELTQRKARFAERPVEDPDLIASRRGSLESVESLASGNTFESVKSDATNGQNSWMFSQIQWMGEVVTLWPPGATPEQIRDRSLPRVEIFKMPGNGTEYVVHDVDVHNFIIGKARLRGTVRVPDAIAVEGFLPEPAVSNLETDTHADDNSSMDESIQDPILPRPIPKALFHPPSFGVTVLGNSHGFDKNGSTSGYVLWVNGRGIMIDPPPYSSATLEREGIRPQMIFGVMITHCHADHDAGAFQKVLTGSRLSLITTPSIYKSFIRKYSALSGLNPTLLQHSHRFRSAIIGTPLKFQGATFHFTYTLHTIPCISFKVEWRGRSIVFTGDHLNLPSLMDKLEEKGVLSKGRADCLRQMPLQECDILLHEAGAPPIHTPLEVLQSLPEKIKDRLYVVHTTALPPDCGLRVAPTGTSGTIRLDELPSSTLDTSMGFHASFGNKELVVDNVPRQNGELPEITNQPGVFSRPACISDAWFVLNLISNIPFFANLSYVYTMEVLEVASIDVLSAGEIVVPARKRNNTLCVVWEGTCTEPDSEELMEVSSPPAVWHAGDWTGPIILQPNAEQAAKFNEHELPKDMIALSSQGVKVIKISMKELHQILMRGSKLYKKYAGIEDKYGHEWSDAYNFVDRNRSRGENPESRNVLDALKINSLLGNLYANQIRALESIAEGPRVFEPGSYLWKAGGPCDFAFLIATGSAFFTSPQGKRRSSGYGPSMNHPSSRNVMETASGNVIEIDKLLHDLPPESEFARLDLLMALREDRMSENPDHRLLDHSRRNANHLQSDRNANKVFARLYASRKAIDGLVVSRGTFLCDTSKMVSGELVYERGGTTTTQHMHSTTLIIGATGCTAWVFPRQTLMPFLEANPGILLSLLGTQVVI